MQSKYIYTFCNFSALEMVWTSSLVSHASVQPPSLFLSDWKCCLDFIPPAENTNRLSDFNLDDKNVGNWSNRWFYILKYKHAHPRRCTLHVIIHQVNTVCGLRLFLSQSRWSREVKVFWASASNLPLSSRYDFCW